MTRPLACPPLTAQRTSDIDASKTRRLRHLTHPRAQNPLQSAPSAVPRRARGERELLLSTVETLDRHAAGARKRTIRPRRNRAGPFRRRASPEARPDATCAAIAARASQSRGAHLCLARSLSSTDTHSQPFFFFAPTAPGAESTVPRPSCPRASDAAPIATGRAESAARAPSGARHARVLGTSPPPPPCFPSARRDGWRPRPAARALSRYRAVRPRL